MASQKDTSLPTKNDSTSLKPLDQEKGIRSAGLKENLPQNSTLGIFKYRPWGPIDPDPINRVRVSLHGSVGAGKSSLTNALTAHLQQQGKKVVAFLENHLNLENQCGNLLANAYRNPTSENRFLLQVACGSLISSRDYEQDPGTIQLEERNMSDTHFIFREAQLPNLSPTHAAILNLHSKALMQLFTMPHMVIFLDTSPTVCLERIKRRNRPGEEKITLDYLTELDQRYKTHIRILKQYVRHVITLNGDQSEEEILADVSKIIEHYGTDRTRLDYNFTLGFFCPSAPTPKSP